MRVRIRRYISLASLARRVRARVMGRDIVRCLAGAVRAWGLEVLCLCARERERERERFIRNNLYNAYVCMCEVVSSLFSEHVYLIAVSLYMMCV